MSNLVIQEEESDIVTSFQYEAYKFSPEESLKLEQYGKKVAQELEQYANIQLQGLQKSYLIGSYLREAKKIVDERSPRSWVEWLENKFPKDTSMAYEAIKISEFIDERGGISVLKMNPNVDKSAILVLSRAKTPEEIRDFFWQKATAGEAVRNKDVNEAISQNKEKKAEIESSNDSTVGISNKDEENQSLYISPENELPPESRNQQTNIFDLLENPSSTDTNPSNNNNDITVPVTTKNPISHRFSQGDIVAVMMVKDLGVDYRDQRVWCHGSFGEVLKIREDGKIDCKVAGRDYSFFPDELQAPSANENDLPYLRQMHHLISKICSSSSYPYVFPDCARAAILNIKSRNIFNRAEVEFVDAMARMLIPDWGVTQDSTGVINIQAQTIPANVQPDVLDSNQFLTDLSPEDFEELMYESTYEDVFSMVENAKKEERILVADFWKIPTKGKSSIDLRNELIQFFKEKQATEMQ